MQMDCQRFVALRTSCRRDSQKVVLHSGDGTNSSLHMETVAQQGSVRLDAPRGSLLALPKWKCINGGGSAIRSRGTSTRQGSP